MNFFVSEDFIGKVVANPQDKATRCGEYYLIQTEHKALYNGFIITDEAKILEAEKMLLSDSHEKMGKIIYSLYSEIKQQQDSMRVIAFTAFLSAHSDIGGNFISIAIKTLLANKEKPSKEIAELILTETKVDNIYIVEADEFVCAYKRIFWIKDILEAMKKDVSDKKYDNLNAPHYFGIFTYPN